MAASPRSAGKTYEEAVGGRWKMDTPMPEAVKKLIVVMNVNEVEKVASGVDFVFSAVDMTKEEIRGHRGGLREDRDTGGLQQQRPPLDAGCAHGDSGGEPGALRRDSLSRRSGLGTDQRIYRGEAQLLHPELRAGAWRPGRSLSPTRWWPPPIRRSPERARPLRTGRRWWRISSPTSAARKRRASRSLCGCWGNDWRTA